MTPLLDIIHAAYLLKLRERMIIRLANTGRLPHRKIGKEYFFIEAELLAWINAQDGLTLAAKFPATPSVTKGITTSPEVTTHPPVPFTRGARRKHIAPSVMEGNR